MKGLQEQTPLPKTGRARRTTPARKPPPAEAETATYGTGARGVSTLSRLRAEETEGWTPVMVADKAKEDALVRKVSTGWQSSWMATESVTDSETFDSWNMASQCMEEG